MVMNRYIDKKENELVAEIRVALRRRMLFGAFTALVVALWLRETLESLAQALYP